MSEFIAQFDDEDLACFARGEGMGSSLVTAGTASAFAGVSKNLLIIRYHRYVVMMVRLA